MRTTISIDDRLLEDLKRRAAERRTTVSRLIEDSVRLLAAPADRHPQAPSFELVTFGKGGRFTTRDVDRSWTLLEQDDIERHGRNP